MGAEAPKEGQYHYQKYTLGVKPVAPVIERVYANFSALPEGSWVLDLGSGSGRLELNAPKPRPYRFLGLDQSSIAINQFREAIYQAGRMDEAMIGDITDLHLPTGREFRGAVSWRVLHALAPYQQLRVVDQVRRILPPEAPFFIALVSDKDWKAGELAARGLYIPNILNECQAIMGLEESFKVDFYDSVKIEGLAKRSGFRVEGIEEFTELTGFEHLQETHPDNTYLFAHLIRQV